MLSTFTGINAFIEFSPKNLTLFGILVWELAFPNDWFSLIIFKSLNICHSTWFFPGIPWEKVVYERGTIEMDSVAVNQHVKMERNRKIT